MKKLIIILMAILFCSQAFGLNGQDLVSHKAQPISSKAQRAVTKPMSLAKLHRWMIAVGFMHVNMRGLLNGTSTITPAQVFQQGFMSAPEKMNVNITTLRIIYMHSMRLRFMTIIPYLNKKMESVTAMGRTSVNRSQGIGDVKALIIYNLWQNEETGDFYIKVGLSLPTGSIKQQTRMATGRVVHLPYPMQLGSGTVDPIISLNFKHHWQQWTWELYFYSDLRLYKNSEHYQLGNNFKLSITLNRRLTDHLELYTGFLGRTMGKIRGQDPQINPLMSPIANPSNQGGQLLSLLLGSIIDLGHSQTLALSLGIPVYQHTNGPQMHHRWSGMIACHLSF